MPKPTRSHVIHFTFTVREKYALLLERMNKVCDLNIYFLIIIALLV